MLPDPRREAHVEHAERRPVYFSDRRAARFSALCMARLKNYSRLTLFVKADMVTERSATDALGQLAQLVRVLP